MRIVDLSVAVTEEMPIYPGDPPVKIQPAGVLARDGFADHTLSFGTHTGTHIDAPMHMLAGGKSLDQMPIDQFVGKGCYVKVDGQFKLETLKQADIEPGDIVLFHTGMSDLYGEPAYFKDYPALSEEMANYLVDQKVKMVGFDTASTDNLKGFPIHKILLAGDILLIENLTNLAPLAGKKFKVYALPLKLSVDGAPARVVAEIEE